MIKKLQRAFGVGNLNPLEGNSIIVNKEKLESRVALLEDGVLEEYEIEREGDTNLVGSIFKGKVNNIEPGLKAMFVDIGMKKNAFLHFWDAIPAALDGGLEVVDRGNKKKKNQKKITSKDIPNIYPVGSEILIQVAKGPISNKGARVTTNLSLAGRYLVLMPYSDQFGISRKVEDPKERAELRAIMRKLAVPEGMGIIMRTVAQGQRVRHFVRDLALLLEKWNEVEAKSKELNAPSRLYMEPGLIERTARDFLTDKIDQIVCDNPETVDYMREISGRVSRRAKKRILHYQAKEGIFTKIGVQKQIDEAFHRQVWLPCGGYLVIDETEALISIDVNTGRNRGKKDVDKMIFQTNLEAAHEIARQLRLRNTGGIVVVDFIDMRHRKDQNAIYRAMRDRLKRDKAKTQVLQMSSVGLMEMTRQRLNKSLQATLNEPCPYCQGQGKIKTSFSMSIEIQRKLSNIIRNNANNELSDLIVLIQSDVLNRFREEDSAILLDMERSHTGRLIFRSDPKLSRESFQIIDAETEKVIYEV